MKEIEGTFFKYQIDREGNVYNIDTGKLIKPYVINSGYKAVHLHVNGKRLAKTVHRLVARTYLPNPLNLPQVNHLDGDKFNNEVSNLEWSTMSGNMQHAFAIGLMDNSRAAASARMKIIGRVNHPAKFKNLRARSEAVSIAVVQLSLDGVYIKEFPSIGSAKKETGAQGIRLVISGKLKKSGGYIWATKEKYYQTGRRSCR